MGFSGGFNLGNAHGSIVLDATGVHGAIQEAQNAIRGGLQSLGDQIAGFGTALRDIGANLTVLSAPVLAFGAAGAQAAGDFESLMLELQTMGQLGPVELERVRAAALQMGADTVFSASDAAGAMLELVRAGMSVEQAMQATRAALDLAATGGISLTDAAGIVSTALAQYGLDATEAARVTDVLAQAALASRADVSDLGMGLANVGPVAAQFGLSLEDTVAALAVFSNNGVMGAEAGTQLRSMLLNLSRPTDNVRDAMNELGISLYDNQGNFVGLDAFVQQLNDSLNRTRTVVPDITGAQEDLAAAQAEWEDAARDAWQAQERLNRAMASGDALAISMAQEGLDNANAALAEMQEELDGAQSAVDNFDSTVRTYTITQERQNELLQLMAGSYGIVGLQSLLAAGGIDTMQAAMEGGATAAELAAARMAGWQGATESLSGSVETLQIEALTPLLQNTLTPFVRQVTEVVNSITAWVQENPELAGTIVQVIAGVAVAGPAMLGLGQVINVVGTLVGGLGSALGFLLSPIGLVVGAVAGLALAFATDFGGIRTALQPVLDMIGVQLANAWTQVQPGLEELRRWFTETALPAIRDFVQNEVTPRITDFINLLLEIWERVSPVLTNLGNWFTQDVMPQVVGIVRDSVLPILREFIGFIEGAWAIVQPALDNLWNWFTQTGLPGIQDFITGTALPAIQNFFNWLGDVWEQVSPALLSILDWFVNTGLPVAGNTISTVWDGVIRPVFDELGRIWTEVVEPAVSAIFNWFQTDGWPAISSTISTVWTDIIQPVFAELGRIWTDVVQPAVSALYAWFVEDGWPAIRMAIDTVYLNVIRPLISTLGSLWETVRGALESLWTWFTQTGWPAIRNIIETVYNQVILPLINTLEAIWRTVGGALTSFRDGIQAVMDRVREFIQPVIDLINGIVEGLRQIGQATGPGGTLGSYEGAAREGGGIVAPGGFSGQAGGFTGFGPSDMVAGVVHYNEYVVPENGALVMRSGGGGGNTYNFGDVVLPETFFTPGMSPQAQAESFMDALEAEVRRRG